MKKYIILSILSLALVSNSAFAKINMIDSKTGASLGSVESETWKNVDVTLPVVKGGEVVVDEGQLVSTCPNWFPKDSCFDISRTQLYRTSMVHVGSDLIVNKMANQFPKFAYWVNKAMGL